MTTIRQSARAGGILFLLTEITAIPAVLLFAPVLEHTDYVFGAGADKQIALGALLEVVLAFANIGTAVALYPVVKKQNEGVALGYACGRVLEAAIILVGVASVLGVVTLRQNAAGVDPGALDAAARTLVAIKDWTFLLGPGFILGINSVLLAYLMHQSRLVPRAIAVLGLCGGSLVFASSIAVLMGVYDQAPWHVLFAMPVFAWEVSLAVWLIAKGVKETPSTEAAARRLESDLALSASPAW
jgi:hypothetical protein